MSKEFKNLFDKLLTENFHRTLTNNSLGDNKFISNKKDKKQWRNKTMKEIGSNAYFLYGYFEKFTTYMFSKYYCFPSWKTITKNIGLSPCGINNAIKKLISHKLLVVYKCKSKDTKYSKNIYFLLEYIGEKQLKFYIEVFQLVYKVNFDVIS